MKVRKIIKIATIFGILICFAGMGYYLFSHWVHMPQWLTFPYDVSICRGEAVINEYLSEEKEISIPDKIMGLEVCSINKDAFNGIGSDAIIRDIPEGVKAGKVYHHESQSYYCLLGEDAWMLEYVGDEKNMKYKKKYGGVK